MCRRYPCDLLHSLPVYHSIERKILVSLLIGSHHSLALEPNVDSWRGTANRISRMNGDAILKKL
jgi:hypothetical protein